SVEKDTTYTKIFVGGLPYHTSDASLRGYFQSFGDIDEAVVITDKQTGKSRGYGFGGGGRACKDANPIIDGRKQTVNLAYLGANPAARRRVSLSEFHRFIPPGLRGSSAWPSSTSTRRPSSSPAWCCSPSWLPPWRRWPRLTWTTAPPTATTPPPPAWSRTPTSPRRRSPGATSATASPRPPRPPSLRLWPRRPRRRAAARRPSSTTPFTRPTGCSERVPRNPPRPVTSSGCDGGSVTTKGFGDHTPPFIMVD
ncbi:unnamed protein product, partial [Tetraodon nigroviridis]